MNRYDFFRVVRFCKDMVTLKHVCMYVYTFNKFDYILCAYVCVQAIYNSWTDKISIINYAYTYIPTCFLCFLRTS